jgi:hypothetical protein
VSMFERAHRTWFRRQADYPVRWWFTDEDFDELRACLHAMNLGAVRLDNKGSYRLFNLPVTIDRTGQPSRLLLRDGTAIPIKEPKEQTA